MKAALTILSAVSFLSLAWAEEVLPPDVQRVLDQRDAAVAKIDKGCLQELVKLKVDYTKQGNLEAANRIVELIKNLQRDEIPIILKGKWIYQLDISGDKRKFSREFNDTHMIDEYGTRLPYTIKGNIVRIHWDGSRFEDLTINPINKDVIRGVNFSGTKFTYTRHR